MMEHTKDSNPDRIRQLNGFPFRRYEREMPTQESLIARSKAFYDFMDTRRTVREFSDQPISREVIENLLMTASTAPSGAHKQPWTFCAVQDSILKTQIRMAAEKEEYESYHGRMTQQWLKDLAPIGTDWHKPFLETAPWLLVVFAQSTGPEKQKHYYVNESVGIACGFLIAAIHEAGLVTLTHTPSPMNFLKQILHRPDNERAFLLLPIGYPVRETYVPDLTRKPVSETIVFY